MKPLIVATVTAPTTTELRRKRDEVRGADLVELRLDTVADPSAAGALAGRKGPVLITCRPTWEGGRFAGSEAERRAVLGEALSRGADYVDVEWRAGFDDLLTQSGGRRIVLSAHDFTGVPEDLGGRIRAMHETGAEMVKVAVRVARLRDLIELEKVGARAGRSGDLTLIAMGEAGLLTRVMPQHFGSAWTYAGQEASLGQVALSTMLEEYRVRSITTATGLFGIVGMPVSHSVSPAMHNAAFRVAGIDAVYLPFAAADADDFVAFGRAFRLRGASVTIPFKVSLFDRVDEQDPNARHVGAVNTIRVVDSHWVGANTDVGAFLEPLRRRVGLAGLRVSILGAGGSARTTAMALGSSEAVVTVHARDARRAEDVAALAGGAHVGPWPPEPGSWDVLVNCTPIGMYPHATETPVPADHLSGRLVYDLVYNPPVTRLLREAQQAGCETIGGLDMLVAQACEQFQWWTSVRPSAAVMREAAARQLETFASASGLDGTAHS